MQEVVVVWMTGTVQSCGAGCKDALVSQWLKRQGSGTGLAGSMQKKRQLTTSRILVSVQTPERHLNPDCN